MLCEHQPKMKPIIISANPTEQSLTMILTTVLNHLPSVRISLIDINRV